MIDPPREEVRTAVRLCQQAGIRPVMITGDHPATALAIARELGIARDGDRTLTGRELDELSDDELAAVVDEVAVYARVSAEHKLRIVRAWKARGQVVAMTGDGVNDAPAVKAADIGIAMGITGTDVTKEASDMVLTDDNFASIVSAVEEGRGIFDNIRKFIHYLLASNASEVLLMLLAALVGWPAPLTAVQLLWINLVTDGLPALALGMEPPERDIMRRRPRPPHEPVITRQRRAADPLPRRPDGGGGGRGLRHRPTATARTSRGPAPPRSAPWRSRSCSSPSPAAAGPERCRSWGCSRTPTCSGPSPPRHCSSSPGHPSAGAPGIRRPGPPRRALALHPAARPGARHGRRGGEAGAKQAGKEQGKAADRVSIMM